MSKNPKGPIPPPKPRPPDGPPLGDPTPKNPLIIQLIRIDESVLREMRTAEPVTVRWEDAPIVVTTLAGVRLGDVKPQDVAKVKVRKSSRGLIADMNVESVECFVEVLQSN